MTENGKYVLNYGTKNKQNTLIQHAGACTACISAFAVGNILGWSSPATPQLLKGAVGFTISAEENSLISSVMTLGAAVSCLPTGYITDKIGRKKTLLGLIPISLVGWSFIIWASRVEMLYAGRFLLGMSAGATCVAAPVYCAEISQKEIRGALGSYFQLLLAFGIVFVYLIGSQLELFWFSIACGVVPIAFAISFSIFPDTPVYLLTNGNTEAARRSLKFFRRSNYEIEQEMIELMDFANKKLDDKESTWVVFISKQGMKGLLISIGLMIFQQFNGINAIIFNANDIFEKAGSSLDAKYESVIIGLMQIIGTIFVTFLVDRIGRIKLLEISAIFMSICAFLLGLYFYLKDKHFELFYISWFPLILLCFFILMFSVGFGPIPWMLMSELIPSRIKGPASSIACVFNWLSAFLVTEFFNDLVNILGKGLTFSLFGIISAIAVIYCFKILPETKGKSFQEIQKELSQSKR